MPKVIFDKRTKPPDAVPSRSVMPPEVWQRIAQTAYDLWERRGRRNGDDLRNWLTAERIVLGQLNGTKSWWGRTPAPGRA